MKMVFCFMESIIKLYMGGKKCSNELRYSYRLTHLHTDYYYYKHNNSHINCGNDKGNE